MRQATELASLASRSGDEVIAATYLDMAKVWLKLAEDLTCVRPANDDTADAGAGDGEALNH